MSMNGTMARQLAIVLAFGLVGWAVCGSIIGIGRSLASLDAALVAHAIGAPIVFAAVSIVYFRLFNFTAPLRTAVIFVSTIAFMDVFVVSILLERSFAMFASIIGFWVPTALIFLATYLVGTYARGSGLARSIV